MNSRIAHRQKKIVLLGAAAVVATLVRRYTKRRRERRMWVRDVYLQRKNFGFYHNLVAELRISSPELFFNFCRMSATSFDYLLSLCGPSIQKKSPREAVSPGERLLITLRFLATGDSYPSLGFGFRMSPSTICNIIFETCGIIWEILAPMLLQLPDNTQWLKIADEFFELWQLPNCLGSIDGKHVNIKSPAHSGSLYYNYKKYFSIILLAICDAKYYFTYVNVGSYGSQSDGGVLKNSKFGNLLQNGLLNIPQGKELPYTADRLPLYFIGDEAFPLQINLMRPYSKKRCGRMPEDEIIFNYRLSRARRTIENTLGIMVSRFRIYHRVINAKPETVDVIIKATTCLHNFIKKQKVDANMYCGDGFIDREVDGNIIPGRWRREIPEDAALSRSELRFGNRSYSKEAFNMRDYLKRYVNGIGSVPWQLEYIRRTH